MAVKGKKCQDIKSSDWISLSFSDSFGPLEDEDLQCSSEKRGKFDYCDIALHPNDDSVSLSANGIERYKSDSKFSNCTVWTDKFKPKTVDHLVVHKKKIGEVEDYLRNVFSFSGYSKILLITGPTGCGKTCTLNILSKCLNINMIEWATPMDVLNSHRLSSDYEINTDTESMKFNSRSKLSSVKLFDEFVMQAIKYGSLLSNSDELCNKKLVLIKDFPNIFIENPQYFHDIIKKYFTHNINSNGLSPTLSPLVFISSDTNIIRDLFPDDLKQQLNITTIAFNPITSANIVKALNRIISLESDTLKHSSSSCYIPSKEDLLFIAESCDGDLRSAILKLQFSVCNKNVNAVGNFKVPRCVSNPERIKVIKSGSKLKNVSNKKHKICEIDKDKKIDFFKSIGRVLYPKKEFSSVSNVSDKNNEGSLYRFVHSPSSIVDDFATEPNKLLNMLHENYFERFTDIKDVSKAANHLSVSDILMSSFWEAKDIMVQYSLNTAVRSLMTSNSKPAQNMFKPMSKSKIWSTDNARKENLNLVRTVFTDLQSEKDVLLDVIPYLNKLKCTIDLTENQSTIISKIATYK